jgi:chorismate dehydratase
MLRLGVVAYLNAQPLAFRLDERVDRVSIRYDVPARCADLLHTGEIDLGTVPAIEFLRGEDYRLVPGVAIGCQGPVASVAIFSSKPMESVRSLALDTNSRTSVALAQILCRRHFGIAPRLQPMRQDPTAMLELCDAAVVIGDAALFFDHTAAGVAKIDLGAAWLDYTGLPFVFAVWAGRAGAVTADDVRLLQETRDHAVTVPADVASAFFPGDPVRAARGAEYLRDNVKYDFAEPQIRGLTRFYREAAEHGLVPAFREPRFY